jgi:glycosyltransferase involved in cell wall biosynthesis
MHVTQPVDGGTAAVVRQLVAGDLSNGRSVTIASPGGELETFARDLGVRWMDLPMTRQPGAADLAAVRRLRQLLPSVDVVYLHSSKAGAVGRLALASLSSERRPRCVFVPHAWSWYVGGTAAPVYRQFERLASRWTDAIVAVSTSEAQDGRTTLPAAADYKLVLIENGVDVTAFSASGAAIPRGPDPLVVCVGRLCRQKGQDSLIRALAMLPDRTVRLVLVGDGPDAPQLRDLAHSLGLDDRIEFVGATDPRPYYRAADVVVLPSRWEGQSLVLLEAMACGSAVLTSPAAALHYPGADRGDYRGAAGVVEADGPEPQQLAAPLARLLTDTELRARLGVAARRMVTEHHSSERTVRDHQGLIDSLSRRSANLLSPVPLNAA